MRLDFRLDFARGFEWRELTASLALAAVLAGGLLTKTGHVWAAIMVLAALCTIGVMLERLAPSHQAGPAALL